ncbi:MAG: hypothetical protein R2788_25250 [Saprospiraceae bacterium]
MATRDHQVITGNGQHQRYHRLPIIGNALHPADVCLGGLYVDSAIQSSIFHSSGSGQALATPAHHLIPLGSCSASPAKRPSSPSRSATAWTNLFNPGPRATESPCCLGMCKV